MFSLAHLADPHVSPLPTPTPGELCGKRLLGYLSWQLRRKHVHRLEVLHALSRDVAARRPDHIAVVGDLTNIALRSEFVSALHWLESLGNPRDVSVIPGNHDAYVEVPWRDTIDLWKQYMQGDASSYESSFDRATFPWVRVRGPVALIGVNTALATLPFLATGTAGRGQLARLETVLGELDASGLFRVVLVHHPPLDRLTKWRKRMVDSAEFAQVIRRAGAELILHGHTHESTVAAMPARERDVPVVSVTSSSSNGGEEAELRARYNVYHIDRRGPGWNVQMEVRGWREDGSVGAIEHAPLTPYP